MQYLGKNSYIQSRMGVIINSAKSMATPVHDLK